ncbi:hypothetical protein Tco_0391127 [Tanacetum coccineum]
MSTSTNNSRMHNDIMAAGSKERPPMLALGFAAALAVLIIEASQSRQHGMSEPDLTSHLPQSLFDVGSGRISIVIVNTYMSL